MRSNSTVKRIQSFGLLLVFILTSCSRGDIPLPSFPTTEASPVATEIVPTPTELAVASEKYPLQIEYAIVWASIEDGLSLRSQAGISATVAKVIPWDSHQIYLTGNSSLLGSSLWLEIETGDGTTGWVRAWNLTEYVPPSQFCIDADVTSLMDKLLLVLRDPEHSTLKDLISPNRGLTLRLNWYSPDVIFSMDEIDSIFRDIKEINWGTMADSGLEISGTAENIIQPYLDDVFFNSPEVLCNELKWGDTAGEVLWPGELDNLNYYVFYRQAEEGGNRFDWRTWAVGIEYVNNQPFIAILIHYSSEL